MPETLDPQLSMKLATDIIVAYLGQRSVEPERLAGLVRDVQAALKGDSDETQYTGRKEVATSTSAEVEVASPTERQVAQQPAVPIETSVMQNYILSLEDGRPYRSLKRHLRIRYGLTPDEYRKKWGLPHDYPMVAPSYAQERSEVAKRIGLGGSKTAVKTGRAASAAQHGAGGTKAR